MIQRLQSVYLGLIVIFSLLMLFLPLGEYTVATGVVPLKLVGHSDAIKSNVMAPIAILSALILVSTFTIFQFKKRQLQIKLTSLIMLIISILTAVMFYFDFYNNTLNEIVAIKHGLLFFTPVGMFLLVILAQRGIKKDEELIRSSDRLR